MERQPAYLRKDTDGTEYGVAVSEGKIETRCRASMTSTLPQALSFLGWKTDEGRCNFCHRFYLVNKDILQIVNLGRELPSP